MTVYNKPLLYIGFLIAVVGGLTDYYTKNQDITIIFQIIAVIVMLWSFKKPKGYNDIMGSSDTRSFPKK
jgi:uncharacterized membrane protein